MDREELALLFFAACNGIRVVGYVPQILRVARDPNRAAGVSCITWVLFTVANVSTVAYSCIVTHDYVLAAVFATNALFCAAICVLTCLKRGCGLVASLPVERWRIRYRRSTTRYLKQGHPGPAAMEVQVCPK